MMNSDSAAIWQALLLHTEKEAYAINVYFDKVVEVVGLNFARYCIAEQSYRIYG